jgi:hypothetical protein
MVRREIVVRLRFGSPCLTSGPTFVTLRLWKRTLSASDSGPTPRRAKSDFLSVEHDSCQYSLRNLLR